MAKTVVTPQRIEAFFRAAINPLKECQKEADEAGGYFWADCKIHYGQEYDVDSGKNLGAGADAPALEGIADVDVRAGIGVQKSREGELGVVQTLRFRSKAALQQGESA